VSVAADVGVSQGTLDAWRQPPVPAAAPIRAGLELDDTAALLAALPDPTPGSDIDPDPTRLLDSLTAALEPSVLEPSR
jgi:hypothetical protein